VAKHAFDLRLNYDQIFAELGAILLLFKYKLRKARKNIIHLA